MFGAGIVFMAAVVYRRIGQEFGCGSQGENKQADCKSLARPVENLRYIEVAALASFLFLIDKNSYFPVAYVANRGFFIALFFGLVSLWAHHNWRMTRRVGWCVVSVL